MAQLIRSSEEKAHAEADKRAKTLFHLQSNVSLVIRLLNKRYQ